MKTCSLFCFKYSDLFLFSLELLFHLLDSFTQSFDQGFSLLLLIKLLIDTFFFLVFVIVKPILYGQNVLVDGYSITEELFQLIDLAMFCLIFFLEQFELHFKVMNFVLESFYVLVFDGMLVGTIFEVLYFVCKERWFRSWGHIESLNFLLMVNRRWRGYVNGV